MNSRLVRLVYCGDIMERLKAVAQPSDLRKALEFFKERTGTPAEIVEVCSSLIASLESAVPEGVEILPDNGCLTWELLLSSPKWDGKTFKEKKPSAVLPTAPDQPLNQQEVIATPQAPEIPTCSDCNSPLAHCRGSKRRN